LCFLLRAGEQSVGDLHRRRHARPSCGSPWLPSGSILLLQGDLQPCAPAEATAEPREQVEHGHLPAVLGAEHGVRLRDLARVLGDPGCPLSPWTGHDAGGTARRHTPARRVAEALDFAGVTAGHDPQAVAGDGEPDRRADFGPVAAERAEAHVALAREIGGGHRRQRVSSRSSSRMLSATVSTSWSTSAALMHSGGARRNTWPRG